MKIIITFITLLFLPKFLNAETYYENYGKIVLKGLRFSGEPVNTSSGKDFGVLEINPKLNIEHNNIDLNLEFIIYFANKIYFIDKIYIINKIYFINS